MKRFFPILIVIFIEGYAILASELIALRSLISYVGNGSDIVSIVIAGVLLPLACGYYYGGIKAHVHLSLRKRLIKNFVLAMLFIAVGLSPVGMDLFFMLLSRAGMENRLLMTPLFVTFFVAPPIFLLGQTIPLCTRLFRNLSASRIAGATLLSSTLGSFLGALFTTLVLMAFFGLHVAVLFVALLLLVCIALLQRKLTLRTMGFPILVMLICTFFNSSFIFKAAHIYYQNTYNTARILPSKVNESKLLTLNKAPAAGYNPKTDKVFPYVEMAEQLFIEPLLNERKEKRDILVLGAGGFTFGRNDAYNLYTYVDIDPDVKELSEKYFLGKPLTANKKFVPDAARSFLLDAISEQRTYDLIFIDAYNGEMWIPEDLVTQDFFAQVRRVLKPEGIAVANLVVNPTFNDDYSLHLDSTFSSVFPAALRLPLNQIEAWKRDPDYRMNVLYLGFKAPSEKAGPLYTDRRNPVFWDKPADRRE